MQEYKSDLNLYSSIAIDGVFNSSIDISFTDMLMLTRDSCDDYPGYTRYRLYHVYRDVYANWFCRHTIESQQRQILALEKMKIGIWFSAEDKVESIGAVHKNEWLKFSEQHPAIEAQYQKWIREGTHASKEDFLKRMFSNPDT